MQRGTSRIAVVLVSLLAACGDDDGGSVRPDAATGTPDMRMADADVGDVPRVEPGPCRFIVGQNLGLTEGVDYSCGDLIVEENRDTHAGRIRLHYIRVKSASGINNGTIYLDGGPGGDGQGILDYASYLGQSFLDGLLVNGDFLVIGQRGTALSIPNLECDPSCGALVGTVDLASYNTAYNADDVNDLRAALGIDQLNVYGISYGSRLGLEVLRRHGTHVRAAVVEGLVPSQIVWTAAIPKSFYGALSSLNTSCAAAGSCGTTFGDLVGKFMSGVDSLNANPVSIDVQGQDFPLDGYSYAYLLFRVMYAKSQYPTLPLVISDLAERRTDRINSILSTWIESQGGGGVSRGLYYSVVCGELYNPPTPNAVETANAGVPAAIIDLFGGSYYSLADTCENWPKGNLQASLAQPVTSSVPTLVSSGRLDPITPPSFGDIAAQGLSNSVHVVHENSGHGATLQSPCGSANLHAFLANPTTTLDMTCAASIATTYMIPGAFAGPTISARQLRAELGLAPMPPFLRDRLRR